MTKGVSFEIEIFMRTGHPVGLRALSDA